MQFSDYCRPRYESENRVGSIVKSAKNLNAAPGFHSVNQYLAYGSNAYQYRVDPQMPLW